MPTTITEQVPIEVAVHRSPIDGVVIVQIDTEPELEDLRINLNDGQIWHGDPESTTGYRDLLVAIQAQVGSAATDIQFRRYVGTLLRDTGEFV